MNSCYKYPVEKLHIKSYYFCDYRHTEVAQAVDAYDLIITINRQFFFLFLQYFLKK